jgi:phosphoribosyl-ATP pyrophosphohydrolase/phosphoribosyl-AMP cyclohydrolase
MMKEIQKGDACHTGRESCFFTSVTSGGKIVHEQIADTSEIYGIVDTLYHTILERRGKDGEKSWTAKLLSDRDLLIEKIQEEAGELCEAIENESDERVISEAADLLYHSLVGLGYREVTPDRVRQELSRRFGKSGIEEKASRGR